MEIESCTWTKDRGWQPQPPGQLAAADLVLVFGARALLSEGVELDTLATAYPKAQQIGCSTAGEIHDVQILDGSLVVTAVRFEHTRVVSQSIELDAEHSFEAGANLARAFATEDLIHVLVLSEGVHVNGSELVKGMTRHLPDNVGVTGGLSGDGEDMAQTHVLLNGQVMNKTAVAVAFYSRRLLVGCGSLGGWDPFGPERLITRSRGNVLYEFDGRSALELYKQYLGDQADDLPAAGLRFPLSLRFDDTKGVVRTILGVDEEEQSLIFAGDVPEGAYARLMKANFNRLLDGAAGAAEISHRALGSFEPELSILISCVGRRMVLKQRTEEEVEAVREILGPQSVLTGFYSYGEISPFTPNAHCELHNQTMTVTTFREP